MIRTVISFIVLFASLGLISRAVFHGPAGQTTLNRPSISPSVASSHSPSSASRTHPSTGRAFLDPSTGIDVIWTVAFDEPPVEDDPEPTDAPESDDEVSETADKVDAEEPEASEVDAPEKLVEALELSSDMLERRERIRDTLAYYFVRPENAAVRSPWGIMHAIIAYGVDTSLIAGGEEVNAIGWLCWNRPCRGQRLFRTSKGRIVTPIGPGYQGHAGQFLAMMAQSKVKLDYPMQVNGVDLAIADLVKHEQATCRRNSELTFKLIGLVHYLDSDAEWKSNTGAKWDIPRLIKEELAQPVSGAACGGTHRMMGFSYAVHKRKQRNESFTGQWLRAQKYVDSYIEYTFKLQNRDGSLSTDWFRGRGHRGDSDRKIQTTGHLLEWLVFSLPEEDLTDPRVTRAVDFLNTTLWDNRQRTLEVGPKGHALRALALYDERVFHGSPGQRKEYLADRASQLQR